MATIRNIVGQITLEVLKEVSSTTYYYLLQPSTAAAPSKPTTNPPTGWNTTEPSYVTGDTRNLYITVQTIYSDGTFDYTTPSLSSSYEAAKQAYNRAQSAFQLASDTGNYFWTLSSKYSDDIPAGSYVSGKQKNIFLSEPTGVGNVLIQSTGLTIRNGLDALSSFTSSALNFYRPKQNSSQTEPERLAMSLSGTDLRFYSSGIIDGQTPLDPDAVLNSEGLTLKKGGLKFGQKGENDYVYLSTTDHPVGENGITIGGYTPTSETSKWRQVIGDKFGVTSDGQLYATGGRIGGTDISNNALSSNKDRFNYYSFLSNGGFNIVSGTEQEQEASYIKFTNTNVENEEGKLEIKLKELLFSLGQEYGTEKQINVVSLLEQQDDFFTIWNGDDIWYYQKNDNIYTVYKVNDRYYYNDCEYESKYHVTKDIEFNDNKTYYELVNNEYVETTDIEFSSGKTYYELFEEYYIEITSYRSASELGLSFNENYDYYSYQITIDSEYIEGKTYYELSNDTYVITEDSEFISGKTYYEFRTVETPVFSDINKYYLLDLLSTYSLVNDNTVNSLKQYYKIGFNITEDEESSKNKNYYLINFKLTDDVEKDSFKNYYIYEEAGNFILTTDSKYISGKKYYSFDDETSTYQEVLDENNGLFEYEETTDEKVQEGQTYYRSVDFTYIEADELIIGDTLGEGYYVRVYKIPLDEQWYESTGDYYSVDTNSNNIYEQVSTNTSTLYEDEDYFIKKNNTYTLTPLEDFFIETSDTIADNNKTYWLYATVYAGQRKHYDKQSTQAAQSYINNGFTLYEQTSVPLYQKVADFYEIESIQLIQNSSINPQAESLYEIYIAENVTSSLLNNINPSKYFLFEKEIKNSKKYGLRNAVEFEFNQHENLQDIVFSSASSVDKNAFLKITDNSLNLFLTNNLDKATINLSLSHEIDIDKISLSIDGQEQIFVDNDSMLLNSKQGYAFGNLKIYQVGQGIGIGVI